MEADFGEWDPNCIIFHFFLWVKKRDVADSDPDYVEFICGTVKDSDTGLC
jgi:hypothetical protein